MTRRDHLLGFPGILKVLHAGLPPEFTTSYIYRPRKSEEEQEAARQIDQKWHAPRSSKWSSESEVIHNRGGYTEYQITVSVNVGNKIHEVPINFADDDVYFHEETATIYRVSKGVSDAWSYTQKNWIHSYAVPEFLKTCQWIYKGAKPVSEAKIDCTASKEQEA